MTWRIHDYMDSDSNAWHRLPTCLPWPCARQERLLQLLLSKGLEDEDDPRAANKLLPPELQAPEVDQAGEDGPPVPQQSLSWRRSVCARVAGLARVQPWRAAMGAGARAPIRLVGGVKARLHALQAAAAIWQWHGTETALWLVLVYP